MRRVLTGGIVLGLGTILYFKHRKTIPKGVRAIKPFDLKKYMGKWYEIARYDFHFEKHIDYATAEYSLNKNTVKVVNRGYNYKKQREVESVGKAVFAGDNSVAELKVSFFGPFYSGYNVIAIDEKYKYALVVGRNRNYMWILSKEKDMPEDIIKSYLKQAEELGFDISKLVWTTYK